MKNIILAFAMSTAACALVDGVKEPRDGGFIAPQPLNLPVEITQELRTLADAARDMWSDELVEMPELPPIYFYAGNCLTYVESDSCRYGVTWISSTGGVELHVAADSPNPRIVLLHETLHWALYMYTGHGDGDHANELWDLIQ